VCALVVGANGRGLGSISWSVFTPPSVRTTHPEVREVLVAVHYVGMATARGYGRLSHGVGAEDDFGSIGVTRGAAR
jgi:hypothetical protein